MAIAIDSNGAFSSWAWPGGYPIYHLCADGGVLCPTCANDPTNPVTTRPESDDPGWRIVASGINWEDELWCDHCSKPIESAYGE